MSALPGTTFRCALFGCAEPEWNCNEKCRCALGRKVADFGPTGSETMDGNGVWLKGAKELLPEAVTLRRRIHQHPELGLHLPKTVAAVREALDGLDVKIETGPSTDGMIVTLQGPTQGRTILLRGDMDAQPMPEDTDLPFKSQEPGRMHACGHDSHTAMLASAVKLLHANRAKLSGTVKFMFQPGEEGHFGALRMIEDGLIDRHPRPDGAFALHI